MWMVQPGSIGPVGPSGKRGTLWVFPAPSQPQAGASGCREVQGACLPPQPGLPELLGLATRAGPRPPNGFPVCFSVDKVSAFSQPSPPGDFPIGTAGAASSLGPALGSVPRAGAGRRFPPAVQVGRVQQKESFSGLPFPSQKRLFGNKNCRAGEQTGEVPGRFRPDALGAELHPRQLSRGPRQGRGCGPCASLAPGSLPGSPTGRRGPFPSWSPGLLSRW